jgi:hypothetical protein
MICHEYRGIRRVGNDSSAVMFQHASLGAKTSGQKLRGAVRCSVERIVLRKKIGMLGRKRFEDLALDPHLVDAMQRAHDKACDILELGRSRDDDATGLVFAKIIELAKAGETDADRLCCRALMEVSDQMG